MLAEDHIIPVVLLSLVAVFLNLCLIVSIKNRKFTLNAIDILQIGNTILVILGVLALTTLNLLDCMTLESHRTILVCFSVNESMEFIFLHSICWTFLAVAVVRRKVCECRGRASVLVTRIYAIKTYVVCAIPIVTMVTLLLTFTKKALERRLSEDLGNATSFPVVRELYGSHELGFKISQMVVIDIFPLLLGCTFYVRIFYVVRQTAKAMGSFITQRNRNPSKLITASVLVLLISTLLIWSVYIICTAMALTRNVYEYLCMYIKIIIFIVYPIGEGLFLSPSKAIVSQSNSILTNRSRTRISPALEEESDMDDLRHPALQGVVRMTIAERDDSSVCGSSNNSLNALSNESENVFTTNEPQPSTSNDFWKDSNRSFIQTSVSINDSREESSGCVGSPIPSRFYQKGLAFNSYKTIAQSSPIRNKRRPRHTFEKMKSKFYIKRVSEPASSVGGRNGIMKTPELSPVDPSASFFSRSFYENIAESSSSSSPYFTKEGYSGLQYAKQTDNDLPDKTVEEEFKLKSHARQKTAANRRWFETVNAIRKNQKKSSTKEKRTSILIGQGVSESEFDSLTERIHRKHPFCHSSSKRGFSVLPPIQAIESTGSPTPRLKTRSISCVNNVYRCSKEGYGTGNKPKKRNKSVSFVSSVEIQDKNYTGDRHSIEVGSKIKLKIKEEPIPESVEPRIRKSSSFDLSKLISRKTSHWMLEKSTPRQECIAKLQEINEYF